MLPSLFASFALFPFLHLPHSLVSFGLAIFGGILTCDQAFLLPFSFWRLREKDAWYFTCCLPVVQNLDFCLIGGKTKDASKAHTDWLQATYLTSGPIRLVFPPSSLFDETTTLRNCFNRTLIGLIKTMHRETPWQPMGASGYLSSVRTPIVSSSMLSRFDHRAELFEEHCLVNFNFVELCKTVDDFTAALLQTDKTMKDLLPQNWFLHFWPLSVK